QARKRGRGRKQSDAAGQIEFDDKAIEEGKKLVAKLKSQEAAVKLTEMELGELADRLKPEYGEKTVAVFAHKIGVPAAALKRWRSAYRAWKGKEAPGASFAVAKELQAHPLREEIVREQPNLTKREARSIMRAYRQAHEEEMDWRVEESRRWFAGAVK